MPEPLKEDSVTEELRRRHAEELKTEREELEKEWKEHSAEYEWWEDRGYGPLDGVLPEEFDQLVPPDVREHFLAAQREALIAFRKLIDFWLDRSGSSPQRRRREGWEDIYPK